MVRERVQREPPRHILEEIKEKTKVMRNKQLRRAAARSRGTRARLAHQSASSIVPGGLLVAVKQNNTALALALQAEKAKVRQANAVILQLKQTLFFQLTLLRRKLREQRSLATSSPLAEASELPVEANVESPRREKIGEGEPREVSPICAESPKMDAQPDYVRMALPPTVMVRQRHGDRERKSRRRSDRVRPIGELTLGAAGDEGPKRHEDPHEVLKARVDDPIRVPVNTRKDGRHRPRAKADASAAKPPERGRKPERAPLKKPWENPKRRARSKSRERQAPPLQQLNTSLGFNDTFDFDCEEAVHLTPFRAKPNHPEDPVTEPAGDPAPDSVAPDPSSPSSPSSESEDSLYVPKKKPRRGCASPETTKVIATRRGRAANASRPKSEALSQDMAGTAVPSVSTLTEVDTTIDAVLSRIGDSLCESQPPLPPPPPPSPLGSRALQQQRQRKKCGLGGSGRAPGRVGLTLSDMTNLSPVARRRCFSGLSSQTLCASTPASPRMRRRTLVVDYKEPSLSAKLRRGDKFTDLRFLPPGSPIFKTKLTGGPSRASTGARDKLGKYNEPFVGCR